LLNWKLLLNWTLLNRKSTVLFRCTFYRSLRPVKRYSCTIVLVSVSLWPGQIKNRLSVASFLEVQNQGVHEQVRTRPSEVRNGLKPGKEGLCTSLHNRHQQERGGMPGKIPRWEYFHGRNIIRFIFMFSLVKFYDFHCMILWLLGAVESRYKESR